MKALVATGEDRGLLLCDVPEPVPGPADVLIRVLRTGICGTDLHIDSWDDWARRTVRAPVIAGHEFVGEVVEVGAAVTGIAVGTVVGAEGHFVCGRCYNCSVGRRHLCRRTELLGVHRDGAFAEYVCVPATNVWVHRTQIDLDTAAIFDPFGNAVHTAHSFPLVGEDVLITGAGPIGLMATAVAVHSGAHRVVVSDLSDARLELARALGATAAANVARTSIDEVRRDAGIVEGFGVGLEMSGAPVALQSMVENMRHGGNIAALGIPSGTTEVDLAEVIRRMVTIRGIYGREIFATWHTMSTLLASGVDIAPVITHRLPYHDHRAAFDVARRGDCGKVLLEWAAEPAGLSKLETDERAGDHQLAGTR